MRCVCGVLAAALLAAALLLRANDAPASELANLYPELINLDSPAAELDLPAAEVRNLHDINRYLYFAGYDLWRNGGFGHGGVVWSPGGIERDGLTLKVLLAGGLYRYHTAGQKIVGRQELVSVMGGWRTKRDAFEATLLAGPDLQAHSLVPDDLGNPMRGIRGGVRINGDVWYQPYERMMVNGSVSASTIGPNYWSRIATGWHVAGLVWAGPEALALGGGRYRQLRLGLHATAFRLGAFEWSLGAGYVRDSDERDGFYARFGMSARR